MLPSFEAAFFVNGPTYKAVGAECGPVGEKTVYAWGRGAIRCPKKKRQSVDRALGANVDWEQYDKEVDACQRPPIDADTPQIAPPDTLWADPTPPAPPEPPKAAPTAPKTAPTPKKDDGGIFEALGF